MDIALLFNIFVFLAAVCIFVPLASRFRLGAVLGYLLAGVLIGPFGLGLIEDSEKIMSFAEFGVVMMLFVIGLELEPEALWRLRKSILGLGGLQMVLTTLAFTGIGLLFAEDWRVSLTVGMALSLSSTALVLKILEERNLMSTFVGETAFSVLLFQDVAVIPILIIMPLMIGAPGGGMEADLTSVANLPGWGRALVVGAAVGAVIAAGRYLSPHLFKAVAKSNLREVFTATSLAVVVGITLLMQCVGVSPALGAFVAGVVLANSEYRHTLETDLEPFKGLLLGLFFISIGMGMDFSLLGGNPLRLISAVLILVSVKAAILYLLGRGFGLPRMHNVGFAFALSQGGEFAFVLFQFAGTLHILPAVETKFLTLVVATSIAVTPLLMVFYNKFVMPKFMSNLPKKKYDKIEDAHQPVIIAGFGRFGQVIGRFLIAQGVGVTILEKDPDQIATIRRFGFKGYFGDAARVDLLRSAGAAKAKLLIIAVDDAPVAVDIATRAREEFPNLIIYARARNRRHAYELHKAGVNHYKREMFDASLAMAQEVMVLLGHKESEMQYRAQQFRKHDEESLTESFTFFENEPELISYTRTRLAELENLLQSDVEEEIEQQEEKAAQSFANSI